MNWSEPRKTFKSSENHVKKRVSTTCLNTPPKRTLTRDELSIGREEKQCPYHFSQPTHVCLTCRRSICLRCAVTYCQQHMIHPSQQTLQLLVSDLQKLTIEPRIEDLELGLKQSKQRQEFLGKKIEKMLKQIELNFQHTKYMLEKKKEQIIQYYRNQIEVRFVEEYRRYDELLFQKLKWLREIQSSEGYARCRSIEELDRLAELIKKEVPSSEAMGKNELRLSKRVVGKDKIKMHSIWSEEKLEHVLYQIENIAYKLQMGNLNSSFGSCKKKRVITEAEENNKNYGGEKQERNTHLHSSNKNQYGSSVVKSGSNPRFKTGRKIDH